MFGLSPRLYLYLALAVALAGGYWYWHHSVYQKGYTEGAESVQVLFDGYRGKIIRLTAERAAENAIKDAQVKATNDLVIQELEAKYEAIATVNGSLSRKLRDLSARACITYLPGVDDLAGTPEASGEPSSQAQIDELTDEYDQSCQRDAARLDAIIAEISVQL